MSLLNVSIFQKLILRNSNGGAQPNLSKELIENIKILKPLVDLINKHPFLNFINHCELLERENIKLSKMQNLLLSKLATIEN